MSTKENKSIAYIYNEMDPSERLEFERDLENDSDLLIEVESLKKAAQSLNKLGYFQPPAHVVDAVCETARKQSAGSKNGYWQTFIYSAAALILVGLTSGIFLMDNTDTGNQTQTEAASISGSPVFSQPVHSTSENFTPWVDNNDILYFQEQPNSGNEVSIDSIRSNSYKKLTPVTDPTLVRPYERLQLTGSHH